MLQIVPLDWKFGKMFYLFDKILKLNYFIMSKWKWKNSFINLKVLFSPSTWGSHQIWSIFSIISKRSSINALKYQQTPNNNVFTSDITPPIIITAIIWMANVAKYPIRVVSSYGILTRGIEENLLFLVKKKFFIYYFHRFPYVHYFVW